MNKHRSHKFDKLINVADHNILKEFFQKNGINIPQDKKITVEYINDLLNKIPNEDYALDIEEKLLCINDIADSSVEHLDEIIEQFHIQCDEEESPETTALRIYLHYNQEAFDLAYDFYLCDFYSERLNHYPVPCDRFSPTDADIERFKEEIQKYLKIKRKTDNCYIRVRFYQDKYYVLIARCESKRTLIELEDKKLKPKVYRPIKEDVIVYNKEASVLSLSSKITNQDDKEFYVAAFGRHILSNTFISKDIFSSKSRLINLSPILDPEFYNRTDDITQVKLAHLFVIHDDKQTMEINLKSDNVFDSMKDVSIALDKSQILSAKLNFYIKDKKRPIPVHLTSRGSAHLKQRKEKNIIEDFLRERKVLAF